LLYINNAVIELASGDYGDDKIDILIMGSQNGRNLQWFDNPETLKDTKSLRGTDKIKKYNKIVMFYYKIILC